MKKHYQFNIERKKPLERPIVHAVYAGGDDGGQQAGTWSWFSTFCNRRLYATEYRKSSNVLGDVTCQGCLKNLPNMAMPVGEGFIVTLKLKGRVEEPYFDAAFRVWHLEDVIHELKTVYFPYEDDTHLMKAIEEGRIKIYPARTIKFTAEAKVDVSGLIFS